MQVTLIGSGNVATVLGRRILHSGHIIHQVFSKNASHAERLALELSASPVFEPRKILYNADIYIIAISDDAMYSMHEWLRPGERLTVHTAGSVPMDTLKQISANYGVLYPLQSLRKEIAEPVIPVLVDANNEWNRTKLSAFARSFADSVGFADDDQRSRLHLAAVMTNNFSNHLYALTDEYCSREGVDFKLILPLLDETVKRLSLAPPVEMQTGPAIRKDEQTLQKHRDMLKDHPRLLKLYNIFSESIMI